MLRRVGRLAATRAAHFHLLRAPSLVGRRPQRRLLSTAVPAAAAPAPATPEAGWSAWIPGWKGSLFWAFVGSWVYSLWVNNRARRARDELVDEVDGRAPANDDERLELRALNDVSTDALVRLPALAARRRLARVDGETFLSLLGEMVQMVNEAVRRRASTAKDASKPLSLEYMADRFDVDDPLRGYLAFTASEGWLQGFITATTFTTWNHGFRWDSRNPEMDLLHKHGDDDDKHGGAATKAARKIDADGRTRELVGGRIADTVA